MWIGAACVYTLKPTGCSNCYAHIRAVEIANWRTYEGSTAYWRWYKG